MNSFDENPLVSIIIPIYNVEKYIYQCLESIANQSLIDFECLLIDDGSPDDSYLICKEFVAKDKRFIYYKKENGGLSDARNYGIDRARGKYFSFVDSDDWVELDFLEKMVLPLQEHNAELSFCDLEVNYDDGRIKQVLYQYPDYCSDVIEGDEVVDLMYKIECYAWNKVYHRSLFIDSKIRYPKGLLFEDIATTPKIYFHCKKVVKVPERLNHYRFTEGSITRSSSEKKYLDFFEGCLSVEEYYKTNNSKSSSLNKFFIEILFYNLSFGIFHFNSKKGRKKIAKTILDFFREKSITKKQIIEYKKINTLRVFERGFLKSIYYILFLYCNSFLLFLINIYYGVVKK